MCWLALRPQWRVRAVHVGRATERISSDDPRLVPSREHPFAEAGEEFGHRAVCFSRDGTEFSPLLHRTDAARDDERRRIAEEVEEIRSRAPRIRHDRRWDGGVEELGNRSIRSVRDGAGRVRLREHDDILARDGIREVECLEERLQCVPARLEECVSL